MQNNSLNSLQKKLENLNATKEEVSQVQSLYIISMYKSIVELLMVKKGDDKKFLEEFTRFLDENIKSLDNDSRAWYKKAIEQENERIIKTISEKIT